MKLQKDEPKYCRSCGSFYKMLNAESFGVCTRFFSDTNYEVIETLSPKCENYISRADLAKLQKGKPLDGESKSNV